MKWIPLSVFAAVFGGLAWFCSNMKWQIPATVIASIAVVLALSAVGEYAVKYLDDLATIFERRQRARNTSAVVMIAEAIRAQHPENAKLLNRFTARAVWDVKIDMETRERDVMLRGTNIHLGFVEFVLNNSRNGQLYPRNRFAEGSFEWDAYKQVTDRAQHNEFELWLSSRLIVAREFDKAPAVFLPPWTPELVKEVMGIVDQIEFYTPRQKVVAKEMPAEKMPVNSNQMQVRDERESLLSDEDFAKIKALEVSHEKKNKMTVDEYLKSK